MVRESTRGRAASSVLISLLLPASGPSVRATNPDCGCSIHPGETMDYALVAQRIGTGLRNRLRRFDSCRGYCGMCYRICVRVEQRQLTGLITHVVAGSSPAPDPAARSSDPARPISAREMGAIPSAATTRGYLARGTLSHGEPQGPIPWLRTARVASSIGLRAHGSYPCMSRFESEATYDMNTRDSPSGDGTTSTR